MNPATDITEDVDTDLRLYEVAVLYPVTLSQKEESDLLKEVEGHFEEAKGKLVSKDLWGRRGISYPIGGHDEGKFAIYHYEIDPAALKEIDRALRIQKNVLRHMMVKPPKGYKIVKWSELYETWLKERETVDQVRAREKEEKLQDQVARKAKKQADITKDRKKSTDEKPAVGGAQISEQLDKLISDDSLDTL